MNRLIATDAYHMTMGYLIEPEKALEIETHVLYARTGGPLLVSELSLIVEELVSWEINAEVVKQAELYWSSQGVPFAKQAWESLLELVERNEGRLPLTVRGVRDGEVVLPGDPIAVFKAPAVFAAVIEPWLIARMAKPLQLATRFAKVAEAVNWQTERLFEVGLRASHSVQDHNDSVRVLGRLGLGMTSSGAAGKANDIASGGSMGHRYTQRFANDYEAFLNALNRMRDYRLQQGIESKVKLSLLLDTRSTLESGLPAAIRLIQENPEVAMSEVDISVRLDSGDLEWQLRQLIDAVRSEIKVPQLWPTIIIESGLTAEKIRRLEDIVGQKGWPEKKVVYGIGGYLVGKTDRDFISLVYKLSDIEGLPVMKFADESNRGKESYPGNVTLMEREVKLGTRRLVAQQSEVARLTDYGWQELFVDLVKDGRYLESSNGKKNVRRFQRRVTRRWRKVANGYLGDEKRPIGVALRPGLSPITRRMVDWLRQYRLNAVGHEMPLIVCPINASRKSQSKRSVKPTSDLQRVQDKKRQEPNCDLY